MAKELESLNEIKSTYKSTGKLPSDRAINALSIEWVKRDWVVIKEEAMGFQRGVVAGMTLLRNIIENKEKEMPEIIIEMDSSHVYQFLINAGVSIIDDGRTTFVLNGIGYRFKE